VVKRRPAAIVVAVASPLALAVGIRRAANSTKRYWGDALNYCTVYADAPKTTASVALRDSNVIYSASTGSFGVACTNAGRCAYYEIGSQGYYVYSRCITDAGYGSNTARCWTDWHT
jgi:hypothetical protein